MAGRLERTYGKAFRYLLFALNPFKKAVIKTECMVHKYINIQALEILKNDKYIDAYCLFSDYIDDLNKGVTWADQDLKKCQSFQLASNPPINKTGIKQNNYQTLRIKL